MRISRSEPSATSNRVRNAAPLRHKFSLAVSSSNTTPRRSRPRTFNGRRTAILRSDRCFDSGVLYWTMGRVLDSRGWRAGSLRGGTVLEKALHTFEHFPGCPGRVYDSSKLAAVPHAM